MASNADTTVDVVIVSHHAGNAFTDCDEAIARALEEDEQQAAAAPADSTGRDRTAGDATRRSTDSVVEVVDSKVQDEKSQDVAQPSAPPLPPGEVASWHSEPQQLQQGEQPPPLASHKAENLEHEQGDQAAHGLHDQELKELSREQQERLTKLPSLLTDSPLVRTLSYTLLQGMSLTKLLPRVNSSIKAAAADDGEELESSNVRRARLEERLNLYCLVERKVEGDGNCQFRALSDQLFRTPHLHGFVRECVCRQLAHDPERYCGFVPGDYQLYCADMARSGTWGDHVTLQAAADYYGLRIMIISSYKSTPMLWIEPQQQRSSRVLWLSFWAEIHYNSLHHADEPPPPLPNDKLLGSRRLHRLLLGSRSLV